MIIRDLILQDVTSSRRHFLTEIFVSRIRKFRVNAGLKWNGISSGRVSSADSVLKPSGPLKDLLPLYFL